MSLIVDEHREYLADETRVNLFRRAIAEVVRPGAVVADIGCGTGILGLLALQAGAARVHAIEATGMIGVASTLAVANGFGDRFHAHEGHLLDVRLPERVDACICDFVGRVGFDAGVFEIYPYARQHLLKPGGVLLPSDISLSIAPVERPDLAATAHFWSSERYGLSLSTVTDWAVNTGYPCWLTPEDLLGEPASAGSLPTGDLPPADGLRAALEIRAARDGTLHGLGAWCTAQLSPGVEMTNAPLAADRIKRRNVFFPLKQPVPVSESDILRIRISIQPAELLVNWSVEVAGAGGVRHARQSHSTLKGMLLTAGTMRRTHPQFAPSLTPRGLARLTTLQLCDGRRPLGDIEELVWERHRELFLTRAEAAAFVAEVVAVYSAV